MRQSCLKIPQYVKNFLEHLTFPHVTNQQHETLLDVGYTEQTWKAKHNSKDRYLTLWDTKLIFKELAL